MRRFIGFITFGFSLLLLAVWQPAFAQHAHINAGARTPAAGSELYFVNGASFVTNSGYVLNLTLATNGPYANLYHGSVTFTALPATLFTGGPAFGHAALGSYLELKTVSVAGPSEGLFGFWTEDEDFGTATKVFQVPVGTTNGTQMFNLSEGDRSPGSDPYGHIHGRRFTVNKPGLYTMGFQIVDTSANGPNGGPMHLPSEIFHMYFQAGISISGIARTESETHITFSTGRDGTYQLESTTDLSGTNTVWTPIGEPHPGHNDLHTVIDSRPDVPHRFYRLKVTYP